MNVLRLPDRILVNFLIRSYVTECCPKPVPFHLICFKQWTAEMVMEIINSALNLKACWNNCSHGVKIDLLEGYKVMTLLEKNEPVLNLAVSKAATKLGATHVTIVDELLWDYDYLGRVFSLMCDVMFVSTKTHSCVQRMSEKSHVPVMCIMSRAHASLQSMATIMAIIEELCTVNALNIAYLGKSHQVLNSYLLLCPMLGANIKFKCCCDKVKVTPLLYKASEELCLKTHTDMKACDTREEVLKDANVVIAGPTPKKEKVSVFKLTADDIAKKAKPNCIFFHTLPRGPEVDDKLFEGSQSRTYLAFQNMQYIAAALMAKAVKQHTF